VLDNIIFSGTVMLGIILIYTVWSYAKGLRASPRELWIATFIKFLDTAVYFAINFSLTLWLSADCGLGDIQAGVFVSIWSVMHAVFALVAGPFLDAFGIKKSFIFTFVLLIISRLFMVWITNPYIIIIVAFLPFAIGVALIEPISFIATKKYTTRGGSSLGFGMLYVVLNLGMAAGIIGFDKVREFSGEAGTILPVIGHLSSYQLIYLIGIGIALVCFLLSWLIRDGLEVGPDEAIHVSLPEEQTGSFTEIIGRTLKKAITDITFHLSSVIKERYFWKYIFIITLTLFVRTTFFHLLYTFPKYGIRVLGEGAKIGTIYATLNPILIVLVVPLVAILTRKFSSYKMLIVGSTISSLSMLIVMIPDTFFSFLTNTVIGELVFVRWLNLPENLPALMVNPPSDFYWPLFIFIIIWSLGEAIWYPKFMQLMTAMAPKGREGTYIALVGLPTFGSNLIVGPLSGLLLTTYAPMVDMVDAAGKTIQVVGDLSHHYMVWIWIGEIAALTPIGLILFRGVYASMKKEQARIEQSEKPES